MCIVHIYKEQHYTVTGTQASPYLDVSKENVTCENLAPKTIKVADRFILSHKHVDMDKYLCSWRGVTCQSSVTPKVTWKTPPRQMGTVMQSGRPQRPLSVLQGIVSDSHFPLQPPWRTALSRGGNGCWVIACVGPFASVFDVTSRSAISPIKLIVLMCKVDCHD